LAFITSPPVDLYIRSISLTLKPQSNQEFIVAATKEKKLVILQECQVSKMAAARALATMAVFLLVALSTSHIAVILSPGAWRLPCEWLPPRKSRSL
jgi:hypothetical protein